MRPASQLPLFAKPAQRGDKAVKSGKADSANGFANTGREFVCTAVDTTTISASQSPTEQRGKVVRGRYEYSL
jgi:hypothetical protein